MSDVAIRPANVADLMMVAQMVRDLASEADAPLVPAVTAEQLASGLVEAEPRLQILVAADGDGIGGMMIAFPVYSTWWGKRGLYVCDLVCRATPAAARSVRPAAACGAGRRRFQLCEAGGGPAQRSGQCAL